MKCINENCPCGLYDNNSSKNCKFYGVNINNCPSFIKEPEKKMKRLTTFELFNSGATHIKINDDVFTIVRFTPYLIFTILNGFSLHDLIKNNYTWTSDRKTWHKFKIEV